MIRNYETENENKSFIVQIDCQVAAHAPTLEIACFAQLNYENYLQNQMLWLV